ncbi:MAG: SusD/RagB family nutrient-binding outer membrane lipoprotein [Weeksellaceae bacterium]
MKNKILSIISLSLLFSCTDNFEDINTDKNYPTTVSTEYVLPTVLFNLADKVASTGYDMGEILPQYGGYYEYNNLDIYKWGADDTFWEMYSYLEDLNDVKELAIETENHNYEAISLIVESYMMGLITDTYGYAPYSEALRADEGLYTPKYDSQEEIYEQLLINLEKANEIINDTDEVKGDIYFNGDMSRWKKFSNSLKLRMLMRISNVKDVSADIKTLVNNPDKYPLILNVEDNAEYIYGSGYPNASPISKPRGARYYSYELIVPTTTLINTLQSYDDPRLQEWVDPKDGTTDYIGLVPGLSLGDIKEPTEYARRAVKYFESPNLSKAWLITSAEVNFLLAEAAERNLIAGSAKEYYEKGVQSSFKQWNVEIPADYLTIQAPYDASTDILYEQKWLALYHSGIEAWIDWKRTGKPAFIKPGPGAELNEVPRRLIYPIIEQSINAESYRAAINALGGDDITIRVWWDKL